MKGKELMQTYPGTFKIVREWFENKMLENIKKAEGVPEELIGYVKERGVSDDALAYMIDVNPSLLFEVFDSLDVYIGIVIRKNIAAEDSIAETVIFEYYVCPKGYCIESSEELILYTRKEAEYYAMLAAIQYIEKNILEYNKKS